MKDMDEEKLIEHKKPMKAVTIRFTQEIYEALNEISEEFDVSMATVIRLAVDNNLSKYLGLQDNTVLYSEWSNLAPIVGAFAE